MVHTKVLFLASLGCALAHGDAETASLLQLHLPPSKKVSLLEEGEDCLSGKCKPPTSTTTTSTTPAYHPATTTTTTTTTTTAPYHPATTTTTTTTAPYHPATTTTTTSTTAPATTRTSSPPPAVSPTASCNGVSCETVCSGTVLRFEGRNVVENTLAGSGSSGGGRMKIVDVADGIDLYISDAKGEKAFDLSSAKWKSGYDAGSWMTGNTGIYSKSGVEKEALRIAMEQTGTYEFKFELKTKAGEAATLDEFPLVFYDMDYYEAVEACGTSGTVLAQDTDLQEVLPTSHSSSPAEGCVKYSAGYKSAESPDDFDHPTPDQAKASVAFIYENTSEWTMKFQLKYYSHRWVLFKSSKALACE